jgi:hypothetical protein
MLQLVPVVYPLIVCSATQPTWLALLYSLSYVVLPCVIHMCSMRAGAKRERALACHRVVNA